MKNVFQFKKGIIGLVLLGVFSLLTTNIFQAGAKIESLSLLTNGLGTCFYRANQSFTAKLLGAGGGYITREFFNGTEECFAEVLIGLSKVQGKELQGAKKRLNTLTSEVHWFHQRLSKKSNKFTRGRALELDLKTRFQKMEGLSNKISDLIYLEKESILSFFNQAKAIFYAVSLILFGIFFWLLRTEYSRSSGNGRYEGDAENILNEFDNKDLTKVEALFRDLLAHNNLNFSAALFNRFFSEVNDKEGTEEISNIFEDIKRKSSLNSIPLETIEKRVRALEKDGFVAPEITLKVPKEKVEIREEETPSMNQISIGKKQKIEKEETIPVESANLENILSKIIDHASSKIFTKGIILDFELDKKIFVNGRTEDLEQVIYHFILSSMNNFSTNQNKKIIKITSKKLGGTLLFDIQDNGNPFSSSMVDLKTSIEKGLTKKESNIDLDFNIGQSLLNDFGGKLVFENSLNEDGSANGRKVRLQFTVSNEEKQPNLISLKRGKKKEILGQFTERA